MGMFIVDRFNMYQSFFQQQITPKLKMKPIFEEFFVLEHWVVQVETTTYYRYLISESITGRYIINGCFLFP